MRTDKSSAVAAAAAAFISGNESHLKSQILRHTSELVSERERERFLAIPREASVKREKC